MGGLRWWAALSTACALLAGSTTSTAIAAFPGENGKIAFWSSQYNQSSTFDEGIWTIEPDGTGEALLIEGAHSPAWSPDGSKLAYARRAGDAGEIYTANADGSGELRLTDDGFVDAWPTWSPDGSSIAWSSNRNGSLEVWIMAADGTGQRQVTSLPDEVFFLAPRWSPLGDSIAYYVVVIDGPQSVHVVGADGSGDHAVTPEGFEGSVPDWAPDGSRLAFISRAEQIGGAVYTVRPDGSDLRRIPNLQGEYYGGGDGKGISYPTFSPDGTKLLYDYIVCIIGRCGEGIVLAEADGSAQRTLTGGVRFEGFGTAVWQPLNPNHPPDCSGVGGDPSSLWPPNKHLRSVSVAGATDPDGDDVTLRVTGVTHDEGGAAGWQPGTSADQVLLRADRDAKGDGRVYTIAFEAADADGAKCTGEATVAVPRHK